MEDPAVYLSTAERAEHARIAMAGEEASTRAHIWRNYASAVQSLMYGCAAMLIARAVVRYVELAL